jgi:hypothetical protein
MSSTDETHDSVDAACKMPSSGRTYHVVYITQVSYWPLAARIAGRQANGNAVPCAAISSSTMARISAMLSTLAAWRSSMAAR